MTHPTNYPALTSNSSGFYATKSVRILPIFDHKLWFTIDLSSKDSLTDILVLKITFYLTRKAFDGRDSIFTNVALQDGSLSN